MILQGLLDIDPVTPPHSLDLAALAHDLDPAKVSSFLTLQSLFMLDFEA
jgi:hypothetical protein